MPGPFCTLLLADLGASVIKIESLPGGDYARYLPPTFGDMGGAFAALNRNKKSLAVNLKDPAGIDIIKRLLPACDILVESYRPGVMERFGLGYESLKAIKPELIYCALTGYGQEGAYHRKAGHDLNYLALSGLLSQIGHRKGPPVVPGLQIADITGAYHGVMGILAALIERGRTGMGKFVDVSLTEASASFLVMALGQYATDGKPPRRGIGELNGEIPAYGIYETRDGRYMALGALEPRFWGAFLKAAGREDLMMEGWESGERATKVKQQVDLSVRIPEWVAPDEVRVQVSGAEREVGFEGRYAQVGEVKPGEVATLSFPIAERTEGIYVEKERYTVIRRGNEVVKMDPLGKNCPLYQRAHYRENRTRWRKIERFVSSEQIRW